MKIWSAVIIALCMFFLRCATYYHLFGPEKVVFFSDQDKVILEKTVKSIDFDFGHDEDVNLDYVFSLYHGYTEFKPGDKVLLQAIDGMDADTLISYSEKMYWLKRVAVYKMERYRQEGDWKNYTFIDKYLLPPISYYSDLLEKQALKKDRSYADKIGKKKKAIDRIVWWMMKHKEFEEQWKYDYNS